MAEMIKVSERTDALDLVCKALQFHEKELGHLIAQLKYIMDSPRIILFKKIRALNQLIEENKHMSDQDPRFPSLAYAAGFLDGLTFLLKPIKKEPVNVCPECGRKVSYDTLRNGFFCPCGWKHYKVSDGEWTGTKPPKKLDF